MCRYCDVPVYIKTTQHTRPLLAPLTPVEELRDKLLDLTGEIYLRLPNLYCPMCGRHIHPCEEDN